MIRVPRRFHTLLLAAAFGLALSLAGRAEDLVTVNFEGVDIRLVVKLLSQLTGNPYIIDEGVKGQVTVMSSRAVPLEQAVEVLRNALAVHHYSIVANGQVRRVVPVEDARLGDPASEPGAMVTRIFAVEAVPAEKLRDVLLPLVSKYGQVSAFSDTNSLVVSESPERLDRIAQIVQTLDRAAASPSRAQKQVFPLRHVPASEMAAVLGKMFPAPREGSAAETAGGGCLFVPSDATSALAVSAPAGLMPEIGAAIARLDLPVSQVLVEALVVEMSDAKTLEWGLELAAAGGAVVGTAQGYANTATLGLTKRMLTGDDTAGISAGFVQNASTVGGLSVPDKGLLVKAARNSDQIRILSSPRILTSNNEQAEILVGRTIPYIRNSQVTAEGGTVRTFDFKDVGLTLKILPQILESDSVRLKVHQEVEDVISTSSEGAVETSKRLVSSTVYLLNAQTAILGGLKTDSRSGTGHRLPLLGDIPVLGRLLSSESNAKSRMNLFLFITPHIILAPADLVPHTQKASRQARDGESGEPKSTGAQPRPRP